MTRFASTWTGPPENASRYNSLAWVKDVDERGRVHLMIWRGKARKPFANYLFPSDEKATLYLEAQMAHFDKVAVIESERAEERKSKTLAMRESLQVGTILHYDWGYDQTNVEFYQVVGRTAATATIRRIAAQSLGCEGNAMSDRCVPVRDEFIGKPMRKLIGPHGLSMDFGTADPVQPGRAYYRSWYA